MKARAATIMWFTAASAASQQLHWQIPSPPSPHGYKIVKPFADYDGDGCRDLLVALMLDEMLPTSTPAHRIVSGTTGTTLWERADWLAQRMIDGGDIDGDGVHDIVMRHGIGGFGFDIQAWSVGQSQWLWQVSNPGFGFGDAMLGDLDLDGDQHADFVTSTLSTLASDIYAYNCRGQLLHDSLPLGRACGEQLRQDGRHRR